MTTTQLLETPIAGSGTVEVLEETILQELNEQMVIGLDALLALLPQYSWNQVFHAVDRLARSGRITLRRHRFDYALFSAQYAA